MKGNLTQREDTGRVNSSPVSAISPIVRLQHGCNHTIEIPGKFDRFLAICYFNQIFVKPDHMHKLACGHLSAVHSKDKLHHTKSQHTHTLIQYLNLITKLGSNLWTN